MIVDIERLTEGKITTLEEGLQAVDCHPNRALLITEPTIAYQGVIISVDGNPSRMLYMDNSNNVTTEEGWKPFTTDEYDFRDCGFTLVEGKVPVALIRFEEE